MTRVRSASGARLSGGYHPASSWRSYRPFPRPFPDEPLDHDEKLARVVVFLVFSIVVFVIVTGMGAVAVYDYVRSGSDTLM